MTNITWSCQIGNATWGDSNDAPVQVLRFNLGSEGVIKPSELIQLDLPVLADTTLGVVLSGRGPVWIFCHLAHHYHVTPWVATFDPRVDGAVVVSTHSVGAPPVGTVVKVPKPE